VVFLQKPLNHVIPNVRIPVAWEEDAEESSTDTWLVKDDDTLHWKTSIVGLTYDPDYQNTNQYIVWFWLIGPAGPKLNAMNEDSRKQEVEAILSFLYAQTVHVSHVLLSNWTGNPYVLGSFSYDRALSSTDDSNETTSSREVLAEPLPSPENPILCFAGEATHPIYYSTMHGAMETGYREADRCDA
jgi:monoamine oxidase